MAAKRKRVKDYTFDSRAAESVLIVPGAIRSATLEERRRVALPLHGQASVHTAHKSANYSELYGLDHSWPVPDALELGPEPNLNGLKVSAPPERRYDSSVRPLRPSLRGEPLLSKSFRTTLFERF
jgi:hypothetical protein